MNNLPVSNTVRAGSAVPVKFSLGGYHGMDVLAGAPTAVVPCDGSTTHDIVEETVTARGSSLAYDADTHRYVYVWKTLKAWAGGCRMLVVKLGDTTVHMHVSTCAKPIPPGPNGPRRVAAASGEADRPVRDARGAASSTHSLLISLFDAEHSERIGAAIGDSDHDLPSPESANS